MTQEYKKTLPMIVAWLSIALSIAAPFLYASFYSVDGNFLDTEDLDSNEMKNYVYLMVYSVACLCVCLIPSVLLLKGIKENRPKLMAPWLYLSYFSLVATIIVMFALFLSSGFPGTAGAKVSLHEFLLAVIGLVVTVVVTIPVKMLYNQFRKPVPVKPAPCLTEVKTTEDDKRYIPIFENV